jgi:hypothetical protein
VKAGVLAVVALLAVTGIARADDDGALAMAVTRELAETIGPRPTGSPAAALGRKAVTARLAAAGLEPREHRFTSVLTPEVSLFGATFVEREEALYLEGTGANVYAVLPGRSPQVVLLSAHLDSDGPDVPGACDDAASVGVLIEVAAREAARARREGPPARTRVFVVVDGEERGLLGSRAFARDRVAGDVKLAISLDCLGTGALALNGMGPLVDRGIAAAALGAARSTGVSLSVPLPHILFSRAAPGAERSDHRSFTERGVPAFHLLSRGALGFDARYHTPGDSFEHVEAKPMGETVRFLGSFLERVDAALDSLPGDASFLPVSLDPTGLTGTPVLVLPGGMARVLGLLCAGLALVALPALARRGRGARGALAALVLIAIGGALVGAAFVAPFALGARLSGVPAAWHAPFTAYVLAGTACAAAVAALLAATVGRWTGGLLVAAGAAIVIDVALGLVFAALGVAEIGLIPWGCALALAAAALVERPLVRRILGLLSFPLLGLLARPALYREGVLTGTLPETGWGYAVVAAALGVALAPQALGFLRATGLASVLGARPRCLALALTLAACALTARAVTRAPFTREVPGNLQLTHWIHTDGLAPARLHGPLGVLATKITLLQEGKPLRETIDVDRVARVATSFEEQGGARLVHVSARTASPDRPIDRAYVSIRSRGQARLELDTGSVDLSPGEAFGIQVFGIGPAGARLTWRVVGADPALDVEVHAYMVRAYVTADVPDTFTVRHYTAVVSRESSP